MTSSSSKWDPTIRARGGPELERSDWADHRQDRLSPDERRVVLTGTGACRTSYHRDDGTGRPACGRTPVKNALTTWPIERARAWRDPCSCEKCFPDGDPDE